MQGIFYYFQDTAILQNITQKDKIMIKAKKATNPRGDSFSALFDLHINKLLTNREK